MKKRDSPKAFSFFLPEFSGSAQNLFEHSLGADIPEAFNMQRIIFQQFVQQVAALIVVNV